MPAGSFLTAIDRVSVSVEPLLRLHRPFYGQGVTRLNFREPAMAKAARIFSSISAPRTSTERSTTTEKQSDSHQLVAVALFAGIGLFVSLIAVIMGMQGVWF